MPLGLRTVPDKLVWQSGVFTVKSGYWVARDMQLWKLGSIASSSQDGKLLKILVAGSVEARRNLNLHRHGERCLGPGELFQVAIDWQHEFEKTALKPQETKMAVPSSLVHWKPPTESCLKMNFDGACDLKNGLCGLGVIFRDSQGVMKVAMAVPQVGNLPPRSVEVLALLHGLRFALHVGFLNIEVEGDALSVINSFKDSFDDLSFEGHIIDEVKSLVQSFNSCSGYFVKREGNAIAHRLAKEALRISQPFLCLESGPEWLHQCVNMDFQCEV
ncbi:uncharacterized protein LOC133737789 [Rosa rugosa]|uniref:uncharacterized protein LOC133737789 n=1 Tax=Rosa rugosa TaxID=74645 RepID=UPI002B405E80|nr:uncharacterized protein LOC133737789 [Rosa rugosa]